MKIKKIWITPPFAIARVGKSSTPCASFTWGDNDLTPRGTGKTKILPTETLIMNQDGEITSEIPKEIVFKDSEGFRPVCPYFELKGEWEDDNGTIQDGSITIDVLQKVGIDISSVTWSVEIGNLKAYHYTQAEQEKIYARLELDGNNNSKQELFGFSNDIDGKESLFINGGKMPMGFVQLSKPNDEFRELRLRFFAPKGKIYAPANLVERVESSVDYVDSEGRILYEKQEYDIPEEDLIVNPNSKWANYILMDDQVSTEGRTNPSGLLASAFSLKPNGSYKQTSIGLIDDVGDGIIKCRIGELEARCRVTIAPPDFAPDRRPFVSLADGLKDRINRDDVAIFDYLEDPSTTEEIRDLFERILETMELMNLDFQNDRGIRENRAVARGMGLPPSEGSNKLWKKESSISNQFLPLTEIGRQRHKRFVALEVLEDKLRENPELLEKWVRKPMTGDKFYDKKMPPLMRGSDRYPMHITQRQYNLLKAWVAYLRKDINTGS